MANIQCLHNIKWRLNHNTNRMLPTMLLSFIKDFTLKFWLENLDYKIVTNLIIVVMVLKLTQISLKQTKLFLRKKFQMNLSNDDKDFYKWSGSLCFTKILLDQDLLPPHQIVLSNLFLRPYHLSWDYSLSKLKLTITFVHFSLVFFLKDSFELSATNTWYQKS